MSEPGRTDDPGTGAVRSPRAVHAIQAVKDHPQWFFRSGRFDTEELISLLVEEAARGGASAVDVRRDDGWVTVSADVDWLAGDVAAFFAPLSYPEGGRNSSRVEVVLTAFCDAVVTFTDSIFEVKSSAGIPEHERRVPEMPPTSGRTIAFLPPAESRLGTTRGSSTVVEGNRPPLRLVQGEAEERITSAVRSFEGKKDLW